MTSSKKNISWLNIARKASGTAIVCLAVSMPTFLFAETANIYVSSDSVSPTREVSQALTDVQRKTDSAHDQKTLEEYKQREIGFTYFKIDKISNVMLMAISALILLGSAATYLFVERIRAR